MKTFIFLALLISTSAIACPNLSGQYACESQDGKSYEITQTQFDDHGVTVYVHIYPGETGGHATYSRADSSPSKHYWLGFDQQSGKAIHSIGTFVSTCQEDSFVSDLTEDFYDGEWVGNIIKTDHSLITMSLDAQENLLTVTENLADHSLSKKTCIRK